MEKEQLEGRDRLPGHSVRQSLLIKAAILTTGMALVLWLGWPLPQHNEHDPSLQSNVGLNSADEIAQTSEEHILTVSAELHTVRGGDPGAQTRISNLDSVASRLDLNQGTSGELEVLPGIGPVLASRIIQHRESKGLFKRIEDLKAIPGIGEARLTRLRPFIRVNQPAN